MKNASLLHGHDRAQRLHRLRRVAAWVALIVLALVLTSVASAATRGDAAMPPGVSRNMYARLASR